ncbi:MAG: glucosyl-3-phosphoglycerate synthase [Wenzhouxiangella sp.]|nr:MAG: glucosyl-3-phosphoglycerate synthase [Nitriliruptor sp.]TVS13708.1 MAG: glucosyl-3-phosphoglycerate synthase [Wenzhouxiangella sp.]
MATATTGPRRADRDAAGELVVLRHSEVSGLSAYGPALTGGEAGPWHLYRMPEGERPPEDLDDVGGVLVLGGVMSAVDPEHHPWMPAELRWLQEAVAHEVPVLGICLGAQLLATALGGEVVPRGVPQVGAIPLRRTQRGRDDPVVSGWRDGTPALFVHEDEVSSLPPDAQPLLEGGDGIPAWRFGSAVAVQFHPEVDAATLARWTADAGLHPLLDRAGVRGTELLASYRPQAPAVVAEGRGLLARFLAGPVAARRETLAARRGTLVPPPLPRGRPIVHHTAFEAEELRERLHATGQRVSVVLPARNEAATVGDIVTTLRESLVDRVGLVDELLVVDADSEDGTGEVAGRAGARVVRQREVLPHLGTVSGKGEAMWKGLAAAEGDLLVYLDADIVDIGPRFVIGLLGPLLHDPDVLLTKAVYDRPLADRGQLRDSGGGRVTELLARPALALWFPELAGLAQPLSGEIAARRSLLEQLPFVQGYGVEVAMLIDIADRFGTEAIRQVDLGRRTHDHQELPALGRMAAELLQVLTARRGDPHAALASELTLWQPARDETGALTLSPHLVTASERPPLREVLHPGAHG